MADVKITVLKRVDPSVIFDGDVPDMPNSDKKYEKCTAFEEGQVYLSQDGNLPERFCQWAWRDIKKDASVLQFGGNFWPSWVKEGEMVSCCTDGFRPVVFKLERVED